MERHRGGRRGPPPGANYIRPLAQLGLNALYGKMGTGRSPQPIPKVDYVSKGHSVPKLNEPVDAQLLNTIIIDDDYMLGDVEIPTYNKYRSCISVPMTFGLLL
jgi:hypothetical protein